MEKLQEENSFKISTLYFKGTLISFLLTLFCIFILAILLSTTNLKENIINPAIIFISMFSILVPAYGITRKIKKKGIVNGGIFGVLYMLLLYLASSIINMKFSLNVNSLIMLGVGVLGGIIGGLI